MKFKILLIATVGSTVALANESGGLEGQSHFMGLRTSEEATLSFSLWNRFASVPYTFPAWESLLDPQSISTASGNSPEKFWASEHTLSLAILDWNNWSASLNLPIFVQGMWGATIDGTRLGLGDAQFNLQKMHPMTENSFWWAGAGIGLAIPSSSEQWMARDWTLVDRQSGKVLRQSASAQGDLSLSALSTLNFSTFGLPLWLDAHWNYQIGGFAGDELYSYGERVHWSLSSTWIFLPTWSAQMGFWGDRDLADWNSPRAAHVFGLGLQKSHGPWSAQISGDWGFDNPTFAIQQSAQSDAPAWTGQARMNGDFELSLGLNYRFALHSDSDKDGVYDYADQCPHSLPTHKVNARGCELDQDEDGVADAADLCPNTPKFQKVDIKGCELDQDQDGIADRLDQCPSTPLGRAVASTGCELDQDQDGIVDALDSCPQSKETFNQYRDQDGCPDEVPALAQEKVLILKGVQFQKGTAEFLPPSLPILDSLLLQLREMPGVKIEIAGHTSSEGKAQTNLKLSESRAKAVLEYLVSKGIAPQRLSAKGYGSSAPIAENQSEQGREMNRRVEFRRIE